MFSKSRINEPGPKAEAEKPKAPEAPLSKPSMDFTPSAPKGKAGASVLSSDLTVVGNLRTTGDIQVEGTVEGDIRAHLLTVGESVAEATMKARPRMVAIPRKITMGRYCKRKAFMDSSEESRALLDQHCAGFKRRGATIGIANARRPHCL